MESEVQATNDGVSLPTSQPFRLRSYQAEMVQESLQANIIVAMDTGSGKTHIALARTAAELEISDPDKLVWFLAPNVALCEQQSKVFESSLPGYGVQVLCGKDGVDHWRDQITWDAVFDNIRIVVSTPQVLLDALSHGFVKMRKLALIIFDEAHHCTGKHPTHTILANFYTPYLQMGDESQLPKILGLSASPVQKAKASGSDLQKLEKNMNAIARTPKINRTELLRYVHRPQLLRIEYPLQTLSLPTSIVYLQSEFTNYDLGTDPYVVGLLAKQNEGCNVSKQLEKVFKSRDTYCYQQLKSLSTKASDMTQELGPSVADWYLNQCITRFDKMQGSEQQLLEFTHDEKEHLAKILRRLPILRESQATPNILQDLSPKVEAFVDVLVAEASQEFTGLVFIEQRVWVAALSEILQSHPRIRGKFNVGTFIGSSQNTKRKTIIANSPEPCNQQDTLDRFRAGEINLILATSVLEEGIDVSSCHLVICFERPMNLRAFIQRRGRARKQESKYFIFLPEAGNLRSPESWESLEEEMKKAYLDDARQVEQAEERETLIEDGERLYQVPSTGALLTLDNASQHLHHFCSTLSSSVYVDSRPQFSFEQNPTSRIIAKVTLPLSVNPAVRTANSLQSWNTERMAMKDASFEAYVALHKEGLVNDNLLPPRREVDDPAAQFQIPDNTPALVSVSETMDPWSAVTADKQQDLQMFYRTLLKLNRTGEKPFFMVLLTPTAMPKVPYLKIYWNMTNQYTIESSWLPTTSLTKEEIETMRDITQKILLSEFSARMPDGRHDFMWLLAPSDSIEYLWGHESLATWHNATNGSQMASELIKKDCYDISTWGLTSVEGDLRKYLPKEVPPNSSETSGFQAIRFPKRRDFLHPVPVHNESNDAYTRIEILDASTSRVGNLPATYAIFALLTPSIMHRYETFMIADTLRTTLLEPLSLSSIQLPLILQAITAPVTGDESNYQRLEFLGDCILKYISSVHLMADNILWPESLLTGKKGKIVSNGFAARSALSIGLERFILTKRFTGAKWAPRYASDLLGSNSSTEDRKLSSKTIADVVEALIGVSYVVGGFSSAFTCIQTLLPTEKWTPIPEANAKLFEASPDESNINNLSTLEELIGYSFKKKMLLLEALTHASYEGPLANCSYERLEFLGDAVLDYIISKRLFAHAPELSHQKMHGIRTSMANAAFLTFRMFETTVSEERTKPSTMEKETHDRCLWQFLRAENYQLGALRDVAIQRHKARRDQILDALEHDQKYPWHLLALTDAPKFLSDIVESVIGAIYIDSNGDFAACEIFVRRLGILDCLQRILDHNIDCLHPKERLGHLAVDRNVQYARVLDDAKVSTGGHSKNEKELYKVQVKVGGEDVGGMVEGLKRLNAETVAAWKAVDILEKRTNQEMADQETMGQMMVDQETADQEMADEPEWFDAEEGGGVEISEDHDE